MLASNDIALTENEIKDGFSDLFDRVTLYRSLKALEESKIIHQIVLNDTFIKYALSDHLVLSNIDPHFHCEECDRVTCLDSSVHIPPGYKIRSAQILFDGVCPAYNKPH